MYGLLVTGLLAAPGWPGLRAGEVESSVLWAGCPRPSLGGVAGNAGNAGNELDSWLLCSLLSLAEERVWKSLLGPLLSLAEISVLECVKSEMKLNKVNLEEIRFILI